MDWFSLAILSGLFYAISRSLSRAYLKKRAGSVLAFTGVHDIIAGIVLVPFFITQLTIPADATFWLLYSIVVILIFLVDAFTFKALSTIGVSSFQIVAQSRHIFILVLAAVVLGEGIYIHKVIGVLLIIGGAWVALSSSVKKCLSYEGYIYTMLAAFCISLSFVFSKQIVSIVGPTQYASMVLFPVGLLALCIGRLRHKKQVSLSTLAKAPLVWASGIAFGVFELLQFSSLDLAEASLVLPVVQSSLIFAIIIGAVFLHEREHLYQKLIGTGIIAGGIITLNQQLLDLIL